MREELLRGQEIREKQGAYLFHRSRAAACRLLDFPWTSREELEPPPPDRSEGPWL